MNYNIKKKDDKEHYKTLIGCIKCLGENTCELYATYEVDEGEPKNKEYCIWFETLLNDKNKLDKGGVLTFPNLENILHNENNVSLPELKEFIKISEVYKK